MAYHDKKACESCGKKDNDWRSAHCSNCLAELPRTKESLKIKGEKRHNSIPGWVLLFFWVLMVFGSLVRGDPKEKEDDLKDDKPDVQIYYVILQTADPLVEGGVLPCGHPRRRCTCGTPPQTPARGGSFFGKRPGYQPSQPSYR